MDKVLEKWHSIVQSKAIDQLDGLLADEATLHSPIVHRPIEGKLMVGFYLKAAFFTLVNESFHYEREWHDSHSAVLEFVTVIDGITVNGVDMITWNNEGKITDFKVMARPLKGINLLHERMAKMLENLK
ncbi:MAG: hypothetical protein U0Y10_06215 [Spirosomataceae bacterium]